MRPACGKGSSKGAAAMMTEELGGVAPAVPAGPSCTVESMQPGETVDVFHRYAQDPNGYFMASQSPLY